MKNFGTAAILVGGKSTRMGKDKKNLRIEGKALLQSIVDALNLIFEQIIIVGCEPDEIPELQGVSGVFPDCMGESASLVGVYSSLRNSTSRYVYVTACDMPNYNPAYIRYMMAQLEKTHKSACVTAFKEWIEPFNAFYGMELMLPMDGYLKSGRKSIFQFLMKHSVAYIPEDCARTFSPDWEMFCNLNTPAELSRLIQEDFHVG